MSNRQRIFKDWTMGTLLYAVVMGFFNDYTDFLDIDSFSTLFLAALVMQALTYATLGLKKWVVAWHRARPQPSNFGLILSVWAIMFFSKFVFLEVIDIIFGDAVQISGFVGLVLIIATMVVASQIIDQIDRRLADPVVREPVR
jgi:hypothetical protein